MVRAREEIETEKSKYQKLLSEKRSIEEKLELLERQSLNVSGNSLRRNASDLSLPYQENGYTSNTDSQNVSNFKYNRYNNKHKTIII